MGRTEKALTVLSFTLLVAVVVWNSWYLGHRLDQAHDTQCRLAAIQVVVAGTTADPDAADPAPELMSAFSDATAALTEECED